MHASETQFEYATRWRRVDRLLSAVAALLAAVSGAGALSSLFGLKTAGLVALISGAVGAVAASLGAPQTKEKAAGAANEYRALQQDARIFVNVDLLDLSDEDARKRLDSLVSRLQELNRQAEIPSRSSWRKARQNLDGGSQSYEVDS
jgi:hypothetical protein